MNWVKALLLLSCLIVGYADLVTTNVILNHGLGELNPFMQLVPMIAGPEGGPSSDMQWYEG